MNAERPKLFIVTEFALDTKERTQRMNTNKIESPILLLLQIVLVLMAIVVLTLANADFIDDYGQGNQTPNPIITIQSAPYSLPEKSTQYQLIEIKDKSYLAYDTKDGITLVPLSIETQ